MRKKRKLSDGEGEETPSKAARTEAVHPEPENRVPHPSGTSPAGYSCAFVWGCNNVQYHTVLKKAVLRIHEILVRIRIRILGSIPLTYGSGCGSGSCYFRHWPSRRFFACQFLKVNLLHKVIQKWQNSRNQGFSYYFYLMIEGSGSGFGFVSLTNGSGSGRP